MKVISVSILSILCLSGCVGVVTESTRISYDAAVRNSHMEAALAGDRESQFNVGKSYCCAPRNDAEGFYNNRKATEFLCLAARQNHAEAAYEIGKFYSGDVVNGIRLIRRALNTVRGEDFRNKIVAYYWFNQAKVHGYSEAAEVIENIETQDISRFTDPQSTPCTLSEVLRQRASFRSKAIVSTLHLINNTTLKD